VDGGPVQTKFSVFLQFKMSS